MSQYKIYRKAYLISLVRLAHSSCVHIHASYCSLRRHDLYRVKYRTDPGIIFRENTGRFVTGAVYCWVGIASGGTMTRWHFVVGEQVVAAVSGDATE
jgi:hypothetical protein